MLFFLKERKIERINKLIENKKFMSYIVIMFYQNISYVVVI